MSHSLGEALPVLQVASYDAKLTTDLTNELLSIHARKLLDRLSEEGFQAGGLFIADCIASGDLLGLCNYDPDVLDLGVTDQSILRQVLAYFSKRDDIDLGVDRESTARDKFLAAERACAVTNGRFRDLAFGNGTVFHPFVHAVLHGAIRKIARLLGECPSLDTLRPRLGPGATTRTPKKNACATIKMASRPACSANFSDPVEGLSTLNVGPDDVNVIDLSIDDARLAFVPKNFKTKRAICTEPSLNGMFQLGLGDYMSQRLLKVGIDLKDQSANQRAALYGSISGASATLDLSSASDTVSIELVRHLLPPDWFDLLMRLRSRSMRDKTPDGYRYYSLEKISSMGNGFTFPLETTIFWAIAREVVELIDPNSRIRVLVYGDDIIVPTTCALALAYTLSELGFSTNAKKSFWTGNFRESCGADYVFGSSVRPVFVTDRLAGGDFFRLHNFYLGRGDFESAAFWEKQIDPSIRHYGPEGFGDGHLHRLDGGALVAYPKRGYGGFQFKTWTFSPKKLEKKVADWLGKKRSSFVPKWNAKRRDFSDREKVTWVEFHPKHDFIVRRLATYVQYERETRSLALTESDRLRSIRSVNGESREPGHIYADRRMPDPVEPGDYDKFFVVPGEGKVRLTEVYIFSHQ